MVVFTWELVLGYRHPCRTEDPRAISGWIGKIWLGTVATFARGSEIWAGGNGDTGFGFYGGFIWGGSQTPYTMIGTNPRHRLRWPF